MSVIIRLLKDRKYCRKEYPLPGYSDNSYRLTVGIDEALRVSRDYCATHKIPMISKLQLQHLLNKHNIKE
jgi:hypothetical protein